ncbi:MAG: Smr/MutS family protein [Nitrospirae bacterium]|nr:Smr/MutS family protein [Nitrospirota bacterium]
MQNELSIYIEQKRVPIDGILDLHTFNPREIKELIPHYLSECRKKGILDVRIIHGKGTGALRETVHAMLRKTQEVESFALAGNDGGGWGATVARLRK